jgi:hypothetical protein
MARRRRARSTELGFGGRGQSVQKVIDCFRVGKACQGKRTGNGFVTVRTDGERIYSYKTLVAFRDARGEVHMLSPEWGRGFPWTVTTRGQLREIRRVTNRCYKSVEDLEERSDPVPCDAEEPRERKPRPKPYQRPLLGAERRRR